jgi:hypothetical protein
MTHRRRGIRPSLEAMEPIALLSTIGGGPVVAAMVRSVGGPIRPRGTFDGSYEVQPSIPDIGPTYQLSGSGHVHGLGQASVSGTLHGIGFIARGQVQGDLTLEGRRGASITLHLTATTQQGGFSPLPSRYSYRIAGGTGEGRGARGTGRATLTLTPGPSGDAGLFTIVLAPAHRAHRA